MNSGCASRSWRATALVLFFAAPSLAGAATAGEFDGWCLPADECTGTPMRIEGDTFSTCEARCTLVNPVPVNDMDATLYQVYCEADGFTPPVYRAFLTRTEAVNGTEEAFMVTGYGVTELERCGP